MRINKLHFLVLTVSNDNLFDVLTCCVVHLFVSNSGCFKLLPFSFIHVLRRTQIFSDRVMIFQNLKMVRLHLIQLIEEIFNLFKILGLPASLTAHILELIDLFPLKVIVDFV